MNPQRKPKPPRRLDQAAVNRMATRYLERYSATAARLASVLKAKIGRNIRAGYLEECDGETISQLVETTVDTAKRIALVDDAVYAKARAATLTRRGKSAAIIRQDLQSRGVNADIAHDAIEATETTDIERATTLARRKRLGPWRAARRADYREKDIAAMARAGFSPRLAKTIIDSELDQA